jgi:hypothetical protein
MTTKLVLVSSPTAIVVEHDGKLWMRTKYDEDDKEIETRDQELWKKAATAKWGFSRLEDGPVEIGDDIPVLTARVKDGEVVYRLKEKGK